MAFKGSKTDVLLFGESLARDCSLALSELGCQAWVAVDLAAVERRLQERPVGLLVAGIQEDADFKVFDLALRQRQGTEGIAVSDLPLAQAILAAATRDHPRHFIARSPFDLPGLVVTARKLISGEIFGMERYDVPVKETLELKPGASRYPAVERAVNFFLGQGVARRIVEKAELALHELAMNALRLGAEPGRGARSAQLAYGIGERTLAVSVRDPFGELSSAALFAALRRVAIERTARQEPGRGAGLGLWMVLKASGRLVVNVAPGRATEVIALFHRANSLGEAAKMGHSFHYFQESNHESKAEH